MLRRRFLVATAAALTAPHLVRAQEAFPLAEEFNPQQVRVKVNYPVGQIVVAPRIHFLYHITAPNIATRYGVGVGKAGLSFQGAATIDVKKEWPTWRPTDEMIERDPHLYGKFIKDKDYAQPGGPGNPLGARALYLFVNGRDTYYRIHGTNQPRSIGQSVSNGCIRMLNSHVTYLYEQIPVGTKVTVL